MGNCGNEPVARLRSTSDGGPCEHRQTLVSQTHAQQRDPGIGGSLNHAPGRTKVFLAFGGTWPGGDHNVAELAGAHTLWKVSTLASRHNEWFAAGSLGDEVGEVERV